MGTSLLSHGLWYPAQLAWGHTQTGKSPLLKDLIFKHRVEVVCCLTFFLICKNKEYYFCFLKYPLKTHYFQGNAGVR